MTFFASKREKVKQDYKTSQEISTQSEILRFDGNHCHPAGAFLSFKV